MTLWCSWFQLVHRELRVSPHPSCQESCTPGCAGTGESDLSGINLLGFLLEGVSEDVRKVLKQPTVSCGGVRSDGFGMVGNKLCVLHWRLLNKINVFKGEGK